MAAFSPVVVWFADRSFLALAYVHSDYGAKGIAPFDRIQVDALARMDTAAARMLTILNIGRPATEES